MDNTNKTEQEKRIENLKNSEAREKRLIIMKRSALWGGVLIVLVGMIFAMSKLGTPSLSTNGTPLSEPVSISDHTRGNPLAKVILVEYSDFQCPACAQFFPVIKAAEEKYGKDILLVYRNFPLPTHDKSNLAARTAEAAAIQGKFWEMHDKLFLNQTSWTNAPEPEKLFIEYANQLGLNKDKFISDLNSAEVQNRVEKDIRTGSASGIQGTPTFYLNGKMLNLQTYGELETNIASALLEAK